MVVIQQAVVDLRTVLVGRLLIPQPVFVFYYSFSGSTFRSSQKKLRCRKEHAV
jgi:hypothetical protein